MFDMVYRILNWLHAWSDFVTFLQTRHLFHIYSATGHKLPLLEWRREIPSLNVIWKFCTILMIHAYRCKMEADGSRLQNDTTGDISWQNNTLCPRGIIHITFYVVWPGGMMESRWQLNLSGKCVRSNICHEVPVVYLLCKQIGRVTTLKHQILPGILLTLWEE